MEIYIIYLSIFLTIFQHCIVSARGGSHDDNDDPQHFDGNEQDLSEHCIYFRYDHNTRYTDIMLCPFGCCGDLDNQKCCEDLEDEKDHTWGNAHFVPGLLIFAGVMLLIAISCCAFGIYKHKKAQLRKTHPAGKNYVMPAPVTTMVYYTPESGLDSIVTDSKKSPERMINTQIPNQNTSTGTQLLPPPPLYSEIPYQPEMPPVPVGSPPPPYSCGIPSAPCTSTELRGSN